MNYKNNLKIRGGGDNILVTTSETNANTKTGTSNDKDRVVDDASTRLPRSSVGFQT